MIFQNNPLLIQLKKKLNQKKNSVIGVVKCTSQKYGFLEVDSQTSYFIPPKNMNKVLHGDRIEALIFSKDFKEIAFPNKLIEPCFTRFVGYIQERKGFYFIHPDSSNFAKFMICISYQNSKNFFLKNGDWVVAELVQHRLNGSENFEAKVVEFIANFNDPLIPWYVVLSRYRLEKKSPKFLLNKIIKKDNFCSNTYRKDLTHLNFFTIDSAHTKDIDDAIFIEKISPEKFILIVAISDPTEYVSYNSNTDNIAKKRSFTNYLPGFNIPMLPRKLSEDICSLKPYVIRPVLACRMVINFDGSLNCNKEDFFLAIIKSKCQFSYENVSNWLEKSGSWSPNCIEMKNQINLLKEIYQKRRKWRKKNALIFQDKPEYRFHLSEKWDILNISLESRRIAHRMIEETMIAANICAANFLEKNLGFGIYNSHLGFDITNANHVCNFLKKYNLFFDPQNIMTLSGFCQLRRKLDKFSDNYINYRMRRFQAFGELCNIPKPHFALGLSCYATWTSPIRKYSDIINHRLIKSIIKGEKNIIRPDISIIRNIIERKRKNRLASRAIESWLYVLFFQKNKNEEKFFQADIIDIYRHGIKARLLKNGANIFIPSLYIHKKKEELLCSPENGVVYIKNKIYYKVTDIITVYILTIKIDTRTIIASII